MLKVFPPRTTYLIMQLVLPIVTSSKIWTVVNWSKNNNQNVTVYRFCFRKDAPPPRVSIDNVPLNSAKTSGVCIQNDLKSDKHVQQMLIFAYVLDLVSHQKNCHL